MTRYIGSVAGFNGLVTIHNLFFADADNPEEAFGKIKKEAKRLGYGNAHVASVISVENILIAGSAQDVSEYVFE